MIEQLSNLASQLQDLLDETVSPDDEIVLSDVLTSLQRVITLHGEYREGTIDGRLRGYLTVEDIRLAYEEVRDIILRCLTEAGVDQANLTPAAERFNAALDVYLASLPREDQQERLQQQEGNLDRAVSLALEKIQDENVKGAVRAVKTVCKLARQIFKARIEAGYWIPIAEAEAKQAEIVSNLIKTIIDAVSQDAQQRARFDRGCEKYARIVERLQTEPYDFEAHRFSADDAEPNRAARYAG